MNPYESPQTAPEPQRLPEATERVSWPTLAGLFVGVVVAATAAQAMALNGISGRPVRATIFLVIAIASLIGWSVGQRMIRTNS